MGSALRGLLWLREQNPDGAALLQAGLAAAETSGARLGTTWWLATMSALLQATGQSEQAQALLERALETAESVGERWIWPWLLSLRGQTEAAQAYAEQQGSARFWQRQLACH